MAVNTMEIYNKIPSNSACSSNSAKSRNLNQCSIVGTNYNTSCSITSKKNDDTKNYIHSPSPYLKGDKVQMVSQITDKRVIHRKATDFASSFPLAIKLYKANSDEFKLLKKANKKVRKSVLTIPNEPTSTTQQTCTVSDMNDSEYYYKENEVRKTKLKKRLPVLKKRKSPKGFEFYDRDAKYCSQFNIDLDCSSTDVIKRFDGNCRRRTYSNPRGDDFQAHDVWTVLRNINRFQFRPSPPVSENSIVTPNKKRDPKRRSNHKEAKYVESCCTEEFAYISSIEVESKSPKSFSQSSSCDRVTVIDKKDEFCKMCKEFEKKMVNNKVTKVPNSQNQTKIRKKRFSRNKTVQSKENIPVVIYNKPYILKQPEANENILNNASGSSDENNSNRTTFVPNSSTENTIVKSIDSSKVQRTCENLIYSENSTNSSKSGYSKRIGVNKDESAQQSKGITRVTLSKGQNIPLSKRMEMQKRKSLLAPKIIKSVSKTSEIDVKRKLVGHKNPLKTLEKSQFNSQTYIKTYEASQFNGLDKHIWPFMVEWYKNDTEKQFNEGLSRGIEDYLQRKCTRNTTNQQFRKVNNKVTQNKQLTKKNRQPMLNLVKPIKDKNIEARQENTQQQNTKQKLTNRFKDKVLKFLYKKQPSQSMISYREIGIQADVNYKEFDHLNKADKYTDTFTNKPMSYNPTNKLKPFNRNPEVVTTRPWSKAKWANDFIDSVINKIKSGVYYNNEDKSENHNTLISKYKEASIQAVLTTKNSYTSYDDKNFQDSLNKTMSSGIIDPLRDLGFDAAIPALVIETFNKNNVIIKHCLTNITLQFDVSVPDETNTTAIKFQKSSLLVPIEGVAGQSKLFKYKTTILNAILPAELCNIIPKMIRNNMNKMETEETLTQKLFTIRELSRSERSPPSLQSFSSMKMGMSQNLRRFIYGTFPKMPSKFKLVPIKIKQIGNKTEHYLLIEPLSELNKIIALNIVVSKISLSEKYFSTDVLETKYNESISAIQTISTTALVPYSASNHNLLETPKQYEFSMTDIIRNYYKYKAQISLDSSLHFLNCIYDSFKNNVRLSLNVTAEGFEKQVHITINNLKLCSLNNKLSQPYERDRHNTCVKKSIEYFESLSSKVEKTNNRNHRSTNCRMKKKPFITLYRKCKSTTNISVNCTRSLNKNLNIEDFFQLIGTKSLASVFDNDGAKKILTAMVEMKNWVSEINSRQALLILLLVNKKDTPNLERFKPLVLQGIAVNRITRAIELDTEIEVIERENMTKFSQYEEISHLLPTSENHDILLEELHWIAKTTASDYQRPFDESSEDLLKSLLEKRRKLNPSYLRIMARYIGLGLLKSKFRH
ncbi:hypothetical protein K1T71_009219 [Dendrolimus kikuchii]|uniref:Uncharacterized protein n=1 Tax=Dendrolimus kikuchii TaxID=765133 RepID=A0ACC1CUA2_9NEOP|nr:hypothetical protein K1T71_009219 [Dendrolimus kikuchii]